MLKEIGTGVSGALSAIVVVAVALSYQTVSNGGLMTSQSSRTLFPIVTPSRGNQSLYFPPLSVGGVSTEALLALLLVIISAFVGFLAFRFLGGSLKESGPT